MTVSSFSSFIKACRSPQTGTNTRLQPLRICAITMTLKWAKMTCSWWVEICVSLKMSGKVVIEFVYRHLIFRSRHPNQSRALRGRAATVSVQTFNGRLWIPNGFFLFKIFRKRRKTAFTSSTVIEEARHTIHFLRTRLEQFQQHRHQQSTSACAYHTAIDNSSRQLFVCIHKTTISMKSFTIAFI